MVVSRTGSRTPPDVRQVLTGLEEDAFLGGGVVTHHVDPPTEAHFADLPDGLDERLLPALASRGIERLYTHQRAAFDHVEAGRHTVVVTPTASGKTLCYNLPVLNAILRDPGARALYLFPTKALARDQAAELQEIMQIAAPELATAVYDGDTPPAERRVIRDRAHVVISNPDMLHTAVLPHHARWMRVFENLKYVVIDELHTYRGVFGSHLANVLRRLRRVCRFHGSDPIFVATSATIGNALAFAERLLEAPVALIEENGAPLGERHLLVLNPPIVNPALGLRASYLTVAREVASRFLKAGIHTIVFAGARTTTEVMTKYLKDLFRHQVDRRPAIVGYRGGYLPRERRAIEKGLRDGSIRGVVSTSALELGIDIGSLDACVLAGYPGTVASTRQQSGRAGRRQGASGAVLVLRSHPLDQYLADHPEFLLEGSPECAHINADNLQILASHLKCAAFELPIEDGEAFGSGNSSEDVPELLAWLEERGVLRHTGGRWHWSADVYPANDISLRSVTSTNFVVVDTTDDRNDVIAEVDYSWAFTTIHEGAIYMVQSEQYHVDRLDWDRRKAFVKKVESEYYTDALSYAQVKILHVLRPAAPSAPVPAEFGEVQVVRKAIGYKKIKFYSQENLGWGDILLPEDTYHTQATWLTAPQEVLDELALPQSDLLDGMHGIAHVAHGLAALLLMCDGRDLGVVLGDRSREWFSRPTRPGEIPEPPPDRFEPTVFLYDQYSGGIGLAEALHPRIGELIRGARDRLRACPCEMGCPSCVGPEKQVGRVAKAIAGRILDRLVARLDRARAEGSGVGAPHASNSGVPPPSERVRRILSDAPPPPLPATATPRPTAVPARARALRERLEALGLERSSGARTNGNGRSAPSETSDPTWVAPDDERTLEEQVEGTPRETPLGSFLYAEKHVPLSARHGARSLEGALARPIPLRAHETVPGGMRVLEARDAVFLDTETTGLAGGTGTVAFLVGTGRVEGDSFVVRQYCMRDFPEEPALLHALLADIGEAPLVTFNGRSFDWPLLKTRLSMHRMKSGTRAHYDLLPPARRLWVDSVDSHTLGTLEERILGLTREGDLPGWRIPQAFFDYLRTGRGGLVALAFAHNVTDVVSMLALFGEVSAILEEPDARQGATARDHHGTARLLLDLGDDARATRSLTAGIRTAPPIDGIPLRRLLGHLHRRAGQFDDALREWEELARLAPHFDVESFEQVAKIQEHRRRDYDAALTWVDEALRRVAGGSRAEEAFRHREQRLRRKHAAARETKGRQR